MSEENDWKRKYRDSVLELESEERRWRHLERALRRLVNRLCAAGAGVQARLDEDLAAVAAANRRDADAEELERLTVALAETITTVDRALPVGGVGGPPWRATHAAAGLLIERVCESFRDEPETEGLREALQRAGTDGALAAILERAAALVAKRGDALALERSQVSAILAQVGTRLDELASYFDSASEATRSSLEATQSLNANVSEQVREMSRGTHAATDLRALRAVVDAGLRSVNQFVSDFRERESARLSAQSTRSERMRGRIADLENETRDLQRKLSAERQIARVDSLTGVANRKAFDERLAQAIAGVRRDAQPCTLLIWDIDNFKSVNDRYGHRAGDLVIQTVAKGLAGAIRATDFLARIGGEEFAVVMSALRVQAALSVAEQLRGTVAALKFHFRGAPVPITASCGLTEIGIADTAESVYERADAALYRAKNGGRNRCEAA
ncbi:MAG: GGDEF domain-containing protein [Steroidobacteraceae bacterium]|nr:GGDEF domain-containing protein [Steroidobacteraceae bacterium]